MKSFKSSLSARQRNKKQPGDISAAININIIYRQVALSIKGCLFMNAGWDYQGIPLQRRAQKSTTDAIESDKNISKHRIQMSRDGTVGALLS